VNGVRGRGKGIRGKGLGSHLNNLILIRRDEKFLPAGAFLD
jgi:hypothetical protein